MSSTPTVHVLFVIDSSGSMFTKADDVRGGFNEYVAKLCEEGNAPEYRLSAVTFDTNVASIVKNARLDQVPQLNESTYQPGGNTALFDALGLGVTELTSAVKTTDKPFGTDRVLVIVMTDGAENSSRRFSKSQVVALIKEREAAGNWTFVYLGADQDAWANAEGLGFARGNTVDYAGAHTKGTLEALARGTQRYTEGGQAQEATFGDQLEINADPNQ